MENEKIITIKVTDYQASKIYQLLMEKGYNFTKAKLPGIAKQYYKLAEKIMKEINKSE